MVLRLDGPDVHLGVVLLEPVHLRGAGPLVLVDGCHLGVELQCGCHQTQG